MSPMRAAHAARQLCTAARRYMLHIRYAIAGTDRNKGDVTAEQTAFTRQDAKEEPQVYHGRHAMPLYEGEYNVMPRRHKRARILSSRRGMSSGRSAQPADGTKNGTATPTLFPCGSRPCTQEACDGSAC